MAWVDLSLLFIFLFIYILLLWLRNLGLFWNYARLILFWISLSLLFIYLFFKLGFSVYFKISIIGLRCRFTLLFDEKECCEFTL